LTGLAGFGAAAAITGAGVLATLHDDDTTDSPASENDAAAPGLTGGAAPVGHAAPLAAAGAAVGVLHPPIPVGEDAMPLVHSDNNGAVAVPVDPQQQANLELDNQQTCPTGSDVAKMYEEILEESTHAQQGNVQSEGIKLFTNKISADIKFALHQKNIEAAKSLLYVIRGQIAILYAHGDLNFVPLALLKKIIQLTNCLESQLVDQSHQKVGG
ncbi:MAG: hypothetical protein Q8K36_01850, partial [Alphaproteobacteria bacterium]|nr:hypothetical protein [Alphaproteobacteria bacterium]